MCTRYSLQVEPYSTRIGDITADVLFGHLCRQIYYDQGEKTLQEFLEAMNNSPIFTISDVLPSDQLPRPISQWDALVDHTEKNQERMMNRNKKYKKVKLVSKKDFLDTYSDYSEDIIQKAKRKIKEGNTNIGLTTYNGNRIDRLTGMTGDNAIFSTEQKYGKGRSFCLYIKVLDQENLQKYHIKKYLKMIFEIWIWAKKSTGKGVFAIKQDRTREDNMERETGQHLLLLSNCIPAQDDPTQGAYTTYTKFGKLGEAFSISWQNFYKKPVIFLDKGSCFKANNNTDYIGHMISDIAVDRPWIWQYGYGCILTF